MASLGCKKIEGGYDYEFESPPSKSLECPVCLLTLLDPHVISCCGNEFCQVCIERVKRDGKPCPLCNEPNFATFLHKKLVRKVNALVVFCPQKEQGCEWKGELGQLQSHLNPCPRAGASPSEGCGYVVVSCAYKCGKQFQRRLLQEHEMESCPKRPQAQGIHIANLIRKVEAVTLENKFLRQELKAHKAEIEEIRCSSENNVRKMKDSFQKELGSLKQLHQQEIGKL